MSNEKFISLENLKQYDEFLDEELNKIKDTVDKEFTFNVKYAESDEIGGAAIKAVNDETGENIAKHFSDVESAIAINKSTLGYQRKNLYNLTDAVGSVTKNGVTFTVNSDKTITVNGTATANTEFIYSSRIYIEVNGYSGYIVTSGLENTINGCYEQINYYDANWQYITGTQVPLSGHILSDKYPIAVRLIRIISGTTVNNVIFKPMLIHPNIMDRTFEPYIDDVDTRITDNKNDIAINKTTLGYQKKNLLNNANVTKTEGGVTFTVNADKSVSLSGTSTGQIFLYFDFDEQLINNQKVILSGCPSGGNSDTYALAIRYYNESGAERYVFDTGSEITVTPADVVQIILVIRSGVNTDGLTFYPMLRYAEVIDDTYEPYVDDVDTRITENKNDITVNQTTLGYQKKNIFNPNAANWKQPSLISIAQDGTITSTITSDTRQWTYNNADYYLTLEAGTYIFTSITETGSDLTYAVINGYTSNNIQVVRIYPNIIGRRDVTFTLTETTTIGFVMKLFTQTCKLMIRHADIIDNVYEPYVDDIDTRLNDNANDIAINKLTLGYTRKNLINVPDTTINEPKYLIDINMSIPKGKYIFTYNTTAASAVLCAVAIYNSSGKAYKQYTQVSGKNSIELETTEDGNRVCLWVESAGDYSDIMLRNANITDDTFEPYIDDVDTRITENKDDIAINKTTLGYTKKNLLKVNASSGTANGITFTVNNDNSVTLNGTSTALTDFFLWGIWSDYAPILLQKNKYICSIGIAQNNTYNGLVVKVMKNTTSLADLSCVYPSNTINSEITGVYISIESGRTFNNYTIYPMIRSADITDGTYEPYIDDVDTRLKKCLPLSGGTMNNESKIKIPFNKNNDTRSMEYSSVGVSCYVAPATGWTSGYDYYTTETTPELLGSIGAFGNSNTFKYYYMGNDYQNPLFKVDDSGNGTFKGSVLVDGYLAGESASSAYHNHAILLGRNQQDYCNFYEYGGIYNFYKSQSGVDTLLGKITSNGWEGNVLGNASSATKLTSSNGSATQPVYFSKGKPVNCTYTLNKSVPSNAVFTDTNTLMTQSNTNANNTYPLLLRSTAGTSITSSSATTGQYSNKFYVNPSTGVLNASSFKTTGTQLLVSGSISASDFNGNNATGAKTLTVSIVNLSNYSSVYLELGNESDGFICGHIPISYLLSSSSNYVYLIGSFTEIDSPCAWSKVKASGNNILINSPQYDASHYYAFVYPLSYKITKS